MTPLAGVRKLMPGHRLVVDRSGVAHASGTGQYPEPAPVDDDASRRLAERLLAELDESVRLRLMSDVPLGAMLSGGIDSSLIVALMARHMTEPVKTFSVGFAEAGEGNELADARFVAEHFGAEHHELELSFAEQTVDLEELVWFMDEPLADLSALGFLALSELAASRRDGRALRPGRRRAARRLPEAPRRGGRGRVAAPAAGRSRDGAANGARARARPGSGAGVGRSRAATPPSGCSR